ncbi:MAG: hypothetical protein ABI183_19480 [Polyangiaceae bacterium]
MSPMIVDSGKDMSDSSLPMAAIEAGVMDVSYFTALPVRGKSVGHTSVVFKLSLDNGQFAAYKPRSHVGGERFHGEIAAYRLGQAWGIDNVPPVIARGFSAADLRGAMDQKALDLFSREVVVESDGSVRGALIPWIGSLEFLPLETGKERARWGAWLDDADAGELDDCDASLAAQISTMILFDTMSGDWDRWSGGNIGSSALGTRNRCDKVLYIDNDGAFFDPVPAAPLAAQFALVKKMTRFSRSFVASLKTVSEPDLEHAIGDEMPGKPLLSRKVIDAFFARRRLVIADIDRKTAVHGEASTLSLP